MKKVIIYALCLTLVMASAIGLSACGSSDNGGEGDKAQTSTLSMNGDVQTYLENLALEYGYEVSDTLAYDENLQDSVIGFRTAGSDAEHAAADYLEAQMNEIGLEEVEKVGVSLDRWQFNGASLSLGGEETDVTLASYASYGTDESGITAEIVDVGKGTAADYEGLDVEGKIVLASINQLDEWWISTPLNEANHQGAAAIITYDDGGYAELSDDMINMQDICADPSIPCVSITANDAAFVKEQIEGGNSDATLVVDNEIDLDNGTGYNVIGKIKGESSDQQIIVSGHYDKYFWGFQDDSTAVGLVMAMAKSMKDAGYTPANDIVFVAHSAEEWGASGTEFDWTTGAWEMINNAKPEWAGKTIAMLNFEMPAIDDGAPELKFTTVPEFASLVATFVDDTILLPEPEGVYPDGISNEYIPSSTMEDGISYRFAGVPYFVNDPDFTSGWFTDRYHTPGDDRETYSEETMTASLQAYGTLAIYLDQTPAIQLDFTQTCDQLEEAVNSEMAEEAGVDVATYTQAIEDFRTSAEAWNENITDINTRYEEAIESGTDQSEIDAIKQEGRDANQVALKTFKDVQDNLIGLILSAEVITKHEFAQSNIETIQGVVAALEKGELTNDDETGALDLAGMINGMAEFTYYSFSQEVADMQETTFISNEENGNNFWGTGKITPYAKTSEATLGILAKAEEENPDFSTEIEIYNNAITTQLEILKTTMDAEREAMIAISEALK